MIIKALFSSVFLPSFWFLINFILFISPRFSFWRLFVWLYHFVCLEFFIILARLVVL